MLFTNGRYISEFEKLDKKIEEILAEASKQQPSFDEQSAFLTRHLLGSIDLSDVEPFKRNLTPDQRKAYVAEMSSVYVRIKPLLKYFIQTQKDFMASGGEVYHGQEEKQIIFARGTINGLYLILDELYKLYQEHTTLNPLPPPLDNTNPFPSIPYDSF
jgi:hypothetical protein